MGGMEGAPCTCCPAQGSRSPFTTQLRAAELWVLSTAGTLEALGAPRAQPSTRHGGNGRPHPAEVVLRNRQVASLHPAALQQQRPVTGRGSCSTGQPPAASRRDTRSATAPLLQPPPAQAARGPAARCLWGPSRRPSPCSVGSRSPRPGRHRSGPSPLLGCWAQHPAPCRGEASRDRADRGTPTRTPWCSCRDPSLVPWGRGRSPGLSQVIPIPCFCRTQEPQLSQPGRSAMAPPARPLGRLSHAVAVGAGQHQLGAEQGHGAGDGRRGQEGPGSRLGAPSSLA